MTKSIDLAGICDLLGSEWAGAECERRYDAIVGQGPRLLDQLVDQGVRLAAAAANEYGPSLFNLRDGHFCIGHLVLIIITPVQRTHPSDDCTFNCLNLSVSRIETSDIFGGNVRIYILD